MAEHYNSRQNIDIQDREFSPIIGLKKFNNWIKSVLIGKFVYRPPGGVGRGPGANVLDIGCGKGGDLNKWKMAKINMYVGLDIAEGSVDDARDRYANMRQPVFPGHFFAHDCFNVSHHKDPKMYRSSAAAISRCPAYGTEAEGPVRQRHDAVLHALRLRVVQQSSDDD